MIIGLMSGMLGTFAFLTKRTMLGDVVAHAALPGIVGAFILTYSSSLVVLMCGGLCAGLCAMVAITLFSRVTQLPVDALLGIVLSVFFGAGLVLLTYVQKLPIASQSVLNKFLFGSAATLLLHDLLFLTILAMFVTGSLFLFWKPLTIVVFDPEYARLSGIPVVAMHALLHLLMVTVIVAGLYAVGVVLMSSLMVAPAVMAHQYARSVRSMAAIAAAWGAVACILGMVLSVSIPHMPTGAVIVVVATVGAWGALLMRRFRHGVA